MHLISQAIQQLYDMGSLYMLPCSLRIGIYHTIGCAVLVRKYTCTFKLDGILVACPRALRVKLEQSKTNPFGRRISIHLGTTENSQ